MTRANVQVQPETLAALKELKWAYRAETIDDVISLLIAEAEPDVYHEFISEDEPEE